MKKLTHIVLALGVFCASGAFAQVKLMVDDNIKVTAINGQEIKHGALQPLKREFNLEAGRHVITARYDRMFDLNRGDHDYLKSGNITITADLADNQTYQLVMPNQPNTYQAAKEYAKAPSLAVAYQGNILVQADNAEERQGLFSSLGSSLGGIFNRGGAVQANQKAIAALNQQNQPTTSPTPTPKTYEANNLDGFMQIWLNSSEEEREKIRQWVQK